jgi:glycosyltransferase involved in cell wall biosynthesis
VNDANSTAGLKVAFITRSTLHSAPGGDTIQIEQTAKCLQQCGAQADILYANTRIDYSRYDLLHFFNITRPADILYHTRQTSTPFVVSPVLIDYSEYDRQHRKGSSGFILKQFSPFTAEYIKTAGRWIAGTDQLVSKSYLYRGQYKSCMEIISRAAHILPNSPSEMVAFEKKFPLPVPFTVVPNGIDPHLFHQKPSIKRNPLLVICAARIEGIKNQFKLIEALNNTEYNLLLIGAAAPNQQEYYNRCRKIAAENVQFINHVPQARLADYYQTAGVHVLPSWFETCGLSSLEAAATGCNIVITAKGYTRDYFGEDAFYCEPDDCASILAAIRKATASPVNNKLAGKIAEQFTWQKAAAITADVYTKIIAR